MKTNGGRGGRKRWDEKRRKKDGDGKQRWCELEKNGGCFLGKWKKKNRIRLQGSKGWRGRTAGGDSEGERGEREWVSE